MGSLNLNGFFENWFPRPPPPSKPPLPAPFASLSFLNLFKSKPKRRKRSAPRRGKYSRMLDQFFWECNARPDHRHTPEVDRILAEDPVFERRDDATPEQIEENKQWWEDFRASPVVDFLRRSEEYADKLNEMALQENKLPLDSWDRKIWRKLPHVTGPDGRPMPRKVFRSSREAKDKFWDWAKQFYFGLWGFQQRFYPPGKPIDAQQAIGSSYLESRYHDFILRSGGFFYKDRLGRSRGPMEIIQLKTAWAAGIIDTHTFIWGEDMDEWAPIGMVYGMEKAIATWEVRLGAAATAALHKLQNGIPLWTPLKGFEKKTYQQLQDEAIESKRRDMAVLKANNGVWPGVKIPSHALFLWASGSEMTTLLEEDHMPNKFISKDLRYRLAKVIPGLRPWEVLSVEQAMDRITYRGGWYREPLASHTTGPPYIDEIDIDQLTNWEELHRFNYVARAAMERLLPGISYAIKESHQALIRRCARIKRRSDKELGKLPPRELR